jgi:hypothetical protein
VDKQTSFVSNHEWFFAAPDRFKDVGDGYFLR